MNHVHNFHTVGPNIYSKDQKINFFSGNFISNLEI